MEQKKLFLESEGDSWFRRNKDYLARDEFVKKDLIIQDVLSILASPLAPRGKAKLLEIGASNGRRIEWLEANAELETHGVEPSAAAVEDATARGLRVKRGTADSLDYEDGTFDIVVFGFCLCMCDADDLFRIAAEAHRVVKDGGWIVIGDFYSESTVYRDYHHVPGFATRKMDYRRMFDWHPSYVCFSHKVVDHQNRQFIDEPNEWVASSVMRRLPSKA
jgi:SAM-dependent methyltransferase